MVKNALMDSYIFYIWYKLIYFCLPLNSAIHRMGNTSSILTPRCKVQEESRPYFIFYCKLSKITLRLHQWTNQSKIHWYTCNISFKITLKSIIMRTSFQFHDSAQLNIFSTLISEILLLSWAHKKPLWRPGASTL